MNKIYGQQVVCMLRTAKLAQARVGRYQGEGTSLEPPRG